MKPGYDISVSGGVKSMLEEFDKVVGLHYLRAIHLNDSKGELSPSGLLYTREPLRRKAVIFSFFFFFFSISNISKRLHIAAV